MDYAPRRSESTAHTCQAPVAVATLTGSGSRTSGQHKLNHLLTIRLPNRGRLGRKSPQITEQQMFGKSDLMNSLGRDLSRVRDKRDALASHVTTLTAQIAELEARLSAENERRERERVVGEIEGIKERLRDFYLAFAHAIAGMRDASVSARAIVPEAPELSNLLISVASEVAIIVDTLLGDLDRRIEPLGAGQAAPQLLQSLDDRCSTAAA